MKIAIVDDEEDLLAELSDSIESLGHQPVLIRDPQQAVGVITSDSSIRVALVDLLMPGMSGCEVIAGLRPLLDLPRRLRVIGMTGHGSVNDICRMTEAGAVAVLLKPFLAEEITQKVRDTISGISDMEIGVGGRGKNSPRAFES